MGFEGRMKRFCSKAMMVVLVVKSMCCRSRGMGRGRNDSSRRGRVLHVLLYSLGKNTTVVQSIKTRLNMDIISYDQFVPKFNDP